MRCPTPTSGGTAGVSPTDWPRSRSRSLFGSWWWPGEAVLWQRLAGTEAALEVLSRRRGRAYDPAVVDAVRSVGVPAADGRSLWEDVLAAEPPPIRRVGQSAMDRALAAVGDFADLRSTWTRGAHPGLLSWRGPRGGPPRCPRAT